MKPLTIALQKGGRLNEESLKLLKDCGLRLSAGSRKLKSEALGDDRDALIDESADLLFHFTLLLKAKGLSFTEIERRLAERHQAAQKNSNSARN